MLQLVMGWHDCHLNRFIIYGKQYGVWQPGGLSFSDDPDAVRLRDLGLRECEKFRYEYDCTDRWHHQLQVEAIQYPEVPLTVPICVAGKRAAPPKTVAGHGPIFLSDSTIHTVMA